MIQAWPDLCFNGKKIRYVIIESLIKYQLRGEQDFNIFTVIEFYLKVMVCGSIGYGGVDEIRRPYNLIHEKGFDVVNHLVEKGMDYSDIDDFRDKIELCQEIVKHDLEYVNKVDIRVILASSPSYGTAMEMLIAKDKGKRIILLAKDKVPTPWPINFSDFIVRGEQELFEL